MKILLGVTGSIASYKAYDLCRELTKLNHEVKVVISHGAEQFIRPETFKYLGAKDVYNYSDDFNPDKYDDFSVLHIELAKWADRFAIVPCSANKISQLSHGYAQDLITSIFLAFTKKVLVFPAMNTNMLNNQLIQDNMDRLSKLANVYIHGTQEGLLACGDKGEGKLENIEIVKEIILYYPEETKDKSVLITTGSTISPLDPVRFISNPSSGLTGYELAKIYMSKGYQVNIIAGYNPHEKVTWLAKFPFVHYYNVNTTMQMFEKVKELIDSNDTYISAAAISDIELKPQNEKIKKDGKVAMPETSVAQDILKYVVENKKQQKIIGFSAETNDLEGNMQNKIKRKPVDLLVGNIVSNGTQKSMRGFRANENEYVFLDKNNFIKTANLNKLELAQEIFNLVEK